MMAASTNFSRVRTLIHLTRCSYQSRNLFVKAACRRNLSLQQGQEFPIERLSLKQQQNGLPYSVQLLSTKLQTQSTETEDTLISRLPYDQLDLSPRFSYTYLLNDIARNIEKRLPFKKAQFCRFMKFLDQQKHLNHAEARIILDSTGMTNISFPGVKRAEFTRWVWNKIQEIGDESMKNDINLFNIYLRVLMDNKAPLTPSEIAAELEARQLTPNRITYLMMIASACEKGDMEEGRKQLSEMKAQGFPISPSLYNSLMWGYIKSGHLEKAEEMFKTISSLNLAANDLTYANLMLGYAEKGDVANIKKLIEDMEDTGIALNQHKTLEVVVMLANEGYSIEAEQVLDIVKDKIKPSRVSVSVTLMALLENGHRDLAFKFNDLLGFKSGKFFCECALLCNLPADDIAGFMKRCRELKYENSDLGLIVREAGFISEFGTALALYNHLCKDKSYTPEVDHLYPTIQYYCRQGNLNELQKLQPLIERMNIWDYATAMELLYPAIRGQGKTCEEVVQILRDHNTLEEGEFNTAMIRTLLCREPLPVVKAEVQKMKTVENIFLSTTFMPALMTNFLRKAEDWKEVFEFVAEIRKKRKFEQNCFYLYEAAKQLLIKAEMSLEPLVDFMIENNLKVREFRNDTIRKAPGVSEEKLQQLYLPQSKGGYSPEFERMDPDNNIVLRFHLAKAANNMDKRTVDGILRRKKLREDMFLDMPSQLALIEMYTKLGDADNALFYTRQIQSRIPTFILQPYIGLSLADALFKDKRYEEALDVLSKNPMKDHKRQFSDLTQARKAIFIEHRRNLLQQAQEEELHNRLVEVLVQNNFMKMGDRPVERMLDSEEVVTQILASEEEIQKLTMDEVQKIFETLIRKDKKEELQKASDLFSQHKSGTNVLYRLCAAFAVEGKLLQARKVLQLPGIQVNREELRAICQHFMKERTPIEIIENFQDVLKNTGYRFDPNKVVLYTLFKRTTQLDLAKGLEFLESGFEAHGEVTPRAAYIYLSNAYERAGKPVPFKIPFDMKDIAQSQKRPTRVSNVANTTESKDQETKPKAPKSKAKKKAKKSKKTEETVKGSEVIEAPVSDVIETTGAPGSNIIEKAEEIKAVLEQADPAVEITEIKEPTKEVLNPVTEEIKDVMAQTDSAVEITDKEESLKTASNPKTSS